MAPYDMTGDSRKEHIEKRRRESTLWQFIHLCGSLQLAMIELITIAIACAAATIYESKFNTQIAQAYIYKAPWFVLWLAVLCVNLFCVTLTRWPWQRRHFGFVITHFGIITLLTGAMVGHQLGFEANVTLHTGQEPTNRLVINRTILQISTPSGTTAKLPFDVDIRPPSPARPRELALPDSNLRLVIDNYTEKLAEKSELAESPLPNAGPGVALEFSSGMMTQTLPVILARMPESAASDDFFGRAHIALLDKLPDRSEAAPPPREIHETQMVFAKYEPVITRQNGKPSGYKIALLLEGSDPHLVIESPNHEQRLFSLASILEKAVFFPGDSTQIVVKGYWPDLEMENGKPVSKSNEPNNPAVLVMIGNDGSAAQGLENQPLLEIAPAAGGGIAYQVSRGGAVQSSGKAKPGESFAPGWADWKALVKEVYPNAILRTRLEPVTGVPRDPEALTSGIHARLVDPRGKGEPSTPAWIPSGQGVVLRAGSQEAFIGFGMEVRSLDFSIQLLNFEVPRDEGTDTPSDFRSTVRFSNPATGQTLDSLIHMNHPASYPAGFWRVAMGRMYKFSQAQWNPRDPGETTLQVLHDPGWPLKWSGSLLICVGIAVMFYLKPKSEGEEEDEQINRAGAEARQKTAETTQDED